MPDGSIPLLISIIVLIGFSAFFSSTETAFTCSSRIKLKSLVSAGNKRAAKVLNLAENHYDKLLSTILIGNNIVNLSASTIAAILFAKILAGSQLNSSVISTAVITIAVLIFGEITPKYIGKACAEKFAMLVYPFISILIVIFYPLNVIFSAWKKLITKIFRFNSENPVTEEEIITMVEEAEEDGTIKESETNLIRSVMDFDDLEAENIIVPRVNICAVEKSSDKNEIKRTFDESGFSRLPVYDKEIDSIVGIVHEKDFYKFYGNENFKNSDFSLEKIMKEPFFSSSKIKISKLFSQMQKARNHMAIILDEYGGTLGLVTMEDILEELVGEIYDEHDSETESIIPCADGSFIINGDTPMHKVLKFFDLDETASDSNTLSGWIIETLGDFPPEGTSVDLQEKVCLKILKNGHNTICKVKAEKK